MHINGLIYVVRINLPNITLLQCPNTILSGYTIYPNVEINNGSILKSNFTWFKRKLENANQVHESEPEWQQAGNDFILLVTDEDVGCQLKVTCQPGDGINIGLVQEAVSAKMVVTGPTKCPFEARHECTNSPVSSNQFRIVSYNLLADIYADSKYSQESLYPYCKPRFVSFDYSNFANLLFNYATNHFCLLENC